VTAQRRSLADEPALISAAHQRAVWALLERNVIAAVEAMVLLALLSFADSHGRMFPALQSLARRAGCSKKKAWTVLNQLRKLHILAVSKKAHHHYPTEYKLVPSSIVPLTTLNGATAVASVVNTRGSELRQRGRSYTLRKDTAARPMKAGRRPPTQQRSLAADQVASAPAPEKVVVGVAFNATVSEALPPTTASRQWAEPEPLQQGLASSGSAVSASASAAPRSVEGRREQPRHADADATLDGSPIATDPNCAILDAMFGQRATASDWTVPPDPAAEGDPWWAR